LGAGVSKSRGVPEWRELTRLLWMEVHGRASVPAWLRDEGDALERVRSWASAHEGAEFARRLCLGMPHPLADQMAIELLERATPAGLPFAERLRSALYRRTARPVAPGETLGVLARLFAADQAATLRRIQRVITFNADDHLENEANRGHHPRRDPVLWPIARESGHPRASRGAGGKPPIPVYHVHGFLPRAGAARRWLDAPDTLVFTDAEYWATVASPLSFANRVVAQALHDSTCIFVGLSMSDVNLIRWLGVRYNAICDDKLSQAAIVRPRRDTRTTQSRTRAALARHFWIRTNAADPEGLVTQLLEERGVASVPIEAWGAPFEALVKRCFLGAS
jgi:hypothetical protein